MSRPCGTFDDLEAVLRSAARLVADLRDDPLLARLLHAFAQMPPQDREVVIGVLEREVGARTLARGMRGLTGWTAQPNPNARLYMRAVGPTPGSPTIDPDAMVLAALRGARVMGRLLEPELNQHFRSAIREAFELVTQDERDALRAVVGHLIRVLDDVERAEANGEPVVLK